MTLLEEAQARLDAKIDAKRQKSGADDGIVIVNGSDIVPEPIPWLWTYWLALGKLHLLAGAPGQGKTTMALAFVATITSGGRWPDGSRCEAANVLIWSGEDDAANTLIPRLIAMGADLSRVFFVTGARIDGEVLPFDPARDLVQLTAAAEKIGNIKLLIVDPVVSAVTGDSHKNTEVRRALQPLVDLAAYLGAAALGITHLSKGTAGRDPTERVTGSIAFTAVVRVVLLAAKIKNGDQDKRILVRSKSNIGPDDGGFEYFIDQKMIDGGIEASHVSWGHAIEGKAHELLADAEQEDDRQEEDKAEGADEALIRIIGRHIVPSRDVQQQMRSDGFSVKQVRSARQRVGVIVKRSGFGAEMASYWKLPDYVVVPTDDDGAIGAHTCQPENQGTKGTNGQEGHEWSPDAEVQSGNGYHSEQLSTETDGPPFVPTNPIRAFRAPSERLAPMGTNGSAPGSDSEVL